jgi:hypothetical protein
LDAWQCDFAMIAGLMDRSAFALGRIFEQASKKLSSFTNSLAGIVPRKLRAGPLEQEERGALLALARAAKVEKIKLFTSRIADDEGLRVQQWPDITSELDLFANVKAPEFEWIALPFDFAKVPGFYAGGIDDIVGYKNALAKIMEPNWIIGVLNKPKSFGFTDREMRNIEATAEVLKLAAPNNHHLLDIFQLWTADVNGLSCFVTCDRKFIRYLALTHKNPFSAKPILPSDLCKEISIPFRPLESAHSDDFYTWGEAPLTRMIAAHDKGQPPPRAMATRHD